MNPHAAGKSEHGRHYLPQRTGIPQNECKCIRDPATPLLGAYAAETHMFSLRHGAHRRLGRAARDSGGPISCRMASPSSYGWSGGGTVHGRANEQNPMTCDTRTKPPRASLYTGGQTQKNAHCTAAFCNLQKQTKVASQVDTGTVPFWENRCAEREASGMLAQRYFLTTSGAGACARFVVTQRAACFLRLVYFCVLC